MTLMIEVELKYPLNDPEDFLSQLLARGAARGGETTERDLYFKHPSRDFSVTGEALRVRWDGHAGTITYKGPFLDAVSKSREECEASLADERAVADAGTVFERLGFIAVRGVEKRRTKFFLRHSDREITVTIDDVSGLGLYAELETMSEEAGWQAARDELANLAERLGLTQSERRSYLELLMERDRLENP